MLKKDGKYDISRAQLKKWLMKQDTYTLHKPARRHYKRNRVIVGGIDELWQMDLADMQTMAAENDGYRYLLVCIDVFSKYLWVIPLKTKTGSALVTAFKKILESGRKPQKIQTDQGTEFFNKHFKDLMKEEEIQLYNTYNETKASIVERVIRTLKTRMWRYFTAKKTMRYIEVQKILWIRTIEANTGVFKRNRLTLHKRMNRKYGILSMENVKRKNLSNINLK